jgi:hypothetical protein
VKFKKSRSVTSNSGALAVHVIDIYLAYAPSNSWVYDTGSIVHICNLMQGLVRTRGVTRGEIDTRVWNKPKAAILTVGMMQLYLPSGFIMELDNCYYVPVLYQNIISTSCLIREGNESNIKDTGCSLYLQYMVHGFAHVMNGLFILNLEGE